jgi:hypothetical protein
MFNSKSIDDDQPNIIPPPKTPPTCPNVKIYKKVTKNYLTEKEIEVIFRIILIIRISHTSPKQ